MDDPASTIAQLQHELRSLRQRNAQLEAAGAEHQSILDELRISDARFRLLVEQSPLSTQIFDPNGWTIQVNRAWENLWGVRFDQIRDYNIRRDPQLVAKGIMPYIERGFAGETVVIPPIVYDPEETLPHRTHHADPRRWVSALIYPVNDLDGNLREVVLIHQDITERQQAEDALRRSEARYRALIDSFPNGSVFLFDRELRYIVAGGTGLQANGLAPEMFEGKTLREIFPPEIAARDEPYLRAALRGETSVVEAAFGDRIYLVHTLPVSDETGAIVGGMVMTQDITERKRAEEQLQLLADASAILGASLNDDETILQGIAQLAVPLLGDVCAIYIVEPSGASRPIAIAGLNGEQCSRDEHRAGMLDPMAAHPVAETIRTGQPLVRLENPEPAAGNYGGDADHAAGDGCLIPPAHVVMPLKVRDQVLGAMVFGWREAGHARGGGELQLTEELARRAAQAIEHMRLYREAQEALRVRDEFLSIAAHELKTPLTTLRGSADLLQRRAASAQPYLLTERDQRLLHVISEQSQRLQQNIDTLLDVSRIGATELNLELRPLDLCQLGRRMVDELQVTLVQHQVTFTCDSASVMVQGDERRLEQVLHNLLQNAVKYSPNGGVIGVKVWQQGSEARVAISDQGIGIPAEAQPRLFQRFFRAPNATDQGIRGLGIGLAIVADIVAHHGGHVDIASVEGEGSTVTVALPLAGALERS